jgi:serine/threonine-protein kinase RsbT
LPSPMATQQSGELPLTNEHDIVLSRQAVRRLAQEQGLSLVDQTKLVTAASELARNAYIYGGGGTLKWEVLLAGSKRGVRLTFLYSGPGIANVELALTDGWTSGHGLGLGLSGARRLVNEFEIESTVGVGTRVTVTRWK